MWVRVCVYGNVLRRNGKALQTKQCPWHVQATHGHGHIYACMAHVLCTYTCTRIHMHSCRWMVSGETTTVRRPACPCLRITVMYRYHDPMQAHICLCRATSCAAPTHITYRSYSRDNDPIHHHDHPHTCIMAIIITVARLWGAGTRHVQLGHSRGTYHIIITWQPVYYMGTIVC